MTLFLHLFIHFFLSLLAGCLVWAIYKKSFESFFLAIISGFLVDIDHFFDYWLTFKWSFDLNYFTSGYQFLESDKLYIVFHSWEYVIILLILTVAIKNIRIKTISLALALGLFLHLAVDIFIDSMPVRAYSIAYRMKNNFNIQEIVYPEHWQKHQMEKRLIRFEK